ncbi:flavin reductase family protein [Streptomyces sp. NL15-2K]|uniref:flavin reductase family protein n=1 Tax=Streptomyces sp. NL15-2K TaxID=376149 RepID=UPI000F58B867|nr:MULTISPECIES: flavin reductase family protein [Actinomycetes]WKX12616.1 flavin reductase family protein [Kutzneria buriramensis]GCB43180.1 NADH-FMN oxidoreductase [Streptomyces sp. NL15-2K]
MNTTEITLQDAFKDVMACVATPVSIVTAMPRRGAPRGATVSAFTSLSITPTMVLVSLDRRSQTLDVIRESGRFGLNVLGADQDDLAMSFASRSDIDKFRGTSWDVDHDLPRIAGASAWIASTVADLVDGGDHVIVLGRVDAAETTGSKAPLVYYRRSFGTHQPHHVSESVKVPE